MTKRQLSLIPLFTACAVLAGVGYSDAQNPSNTNTVSWKPYPPNKANSNPGPPATKGWIEYRGEFTNGANKWQAVSSVRYIQDIPQAGTGGTLKQDFLDRDNNGQLGQMNALGQVVPLRVMMDPGKYNVWMAVIYQRPDPNDKSKTEMDTKLSSIETIEIK